MGHNYNKDDDYKRDIRLENAQTGMDEGTPHYHTPVARKKPSRFWLLILSFLPGLGHIYMGLIRRGLFYISALALTIFFTSVVVPIFGILGIITGFAITAIYAVAFFEAFGIRRDIIMGKEVKDTLPNLAWIGGNKAILIVVGIIFAIAIGAHILARLPWYAWVILGIVAVCYAPYLRKKKNEKSQNNENQ